MRSLFGARARLTAERMGTFKEPHFEKYCSYLHCTTCTLTILAYFKTKMYIRVKYMFNVCAWIKEYVISISIRQFGWEIVFVSKHGR